MALKPKFKPSDINKKLMQDALRIEKAMIETLRRAGEEFVTDAKNKAYVNLAFRKGVYDDQTSNLKSSIGYFIVKDNRIIDYTLYGESQEGLAAAKNALSEVEPRKGIRLIGVAGMNYAAYVESMGYNVISSQAMVAIDVVGEQLKKLSKKTGKKMGLSGSGVSYKL